MPGTNFGIWLRRFENFLELREVTDDRRKRLVFLDEIGPENYGALETMFPGAKLEDETYPQLTKKTEERYKPKVLLL